MKYMFFATVVLVLAGTFEVEGQISENDKFFVSPSTEVLATIVYQQSSPLRIEQFVVVKTNSGKFDSFYTIRNIGDKPVRYYKVARWYSDNSGYVGDGIMPTNEVLRPKQSISTIPRQLMTPSSTIQSPVCSSLRRIAFIMVVEIGFADKTVLSFEKEFRELEAHLERFETIYDAPSH